MRGYYEAFNPKTGEHSDNGQMADWERGTLYAQARDTSVVVYMLGEPVMNFHFTPTHDNRCAVTIPLEGGMLMIMHPEDDRKCKHSLDLASGVLDCSRIRVAYVLRQLRTTHEYYADSSRIKLTENEQRDKRPRATPLPSV